MTTQASGVRSSASYVPLWRRVLLYLTLIAFAIAYLIPVYLLIVTSMKRQTVFFADLNYHFLFSEGVSTTTTVTAQDRTDTDDGEIKSNRQWWELRAGMLFFLGD